MLDGIEDSDLVDIDGDIDFVSLNKLAFRFSDAVIQGKPGDGSTDKRCC